MFWFFLAIGLIIVALIWGIWTAIGLAILGAIVLAILSNAN